MVLQDAWLLWLLLPLWALAAIAWATLEYLDQRGRIRRSNVLSYPSIKLVASASATSRLYLRRAVQALRWLTLLLLVIAMARPQTVRGKRRVITQGIGMVLVVDASGSMRALDLDSGRPIAERRNRLQVVQDVVSRFVAKRASDQLGLVVFGAEAFMQCPLTLDHGLLATLLGNLEIGMAGDATAIGSGLGTALRLLAKTKAKSKVVVLLTDGVNNTGQLSPKQAAEIARALDVRVYTVGAGTRGRAPFIIDRPLFGKTVVYDDVGIDDDALREIAATTGGKYFRAEDKAALASIYADIDRMEKSDIKAPEHIDYNDHAGWLLAAALLLLLLETLALTTVLRRLP